MLNISCLTGKEILKDFKQEENFKKFLKLITKEYGESSPKFSFAKLIFSHLPQNLIEILSDNDLLSFLNYLYDVLNNRKRKKYYMDKIHALESKFFIGNFSILSVVTDDRPFIVDSIREYFYEIKYNQQFLLHPIFNVKRDKRGNIVEIGDPDLGFNNESFVIIFLEEIDEEKLHEISSEIEQIYDEIILAVDDYPKMKTVLSNLSEDYRNKNPEVADFIDWLIDGAFILQGIRILDVTDLQKGEFKADQLGVYKLNRTTNIIPKLVDAIREKRLKFVEGYPVIIDKALYKSKIKKRKNYDRIMFVEYDNGKCRAVTILGVFGKIGIATPPHKISLLRKKIDNLFNYFKFVKGSHDFKWVQDTLNNYPKTEIFNLDKDSLVEVIRLLLTIQGKNQIRIYTKHFLPSKHLYALIVFPSDRYSTEVVNSISEKVAEYYGGKTLDISVRHDEHGYVFLHLHVLAKEVKVIEQKDETGLKDIVINEIKDWNDLLHDVLSYKYTGRIADDLYNIFANNLSESYKSKTPPSEAAVDVKILYDLKDIYARLSTYNNKVYLKIYSKARILLTDIMPVIDNMGLKVIEDEIYEVKTGKDSLYLSSILLDDVGECEKFVNTFGKILPEMVVAVVKEKCENDKLNSLLLKEQLNYREVEILRTLRNYIAQVDTGLGRATISQTLLKYPDITKKIVKLFEEKFNISKEVKAYEEIKRDVWENLDKVQTLVEDSVFRKILKLIDAIVRTNFYKVPERNYISIKISSRNLDFIPDPKPLYEIYVHSPQMEGVHLRGGKVARGGLRFSDRPDDFRTEILGLMKTQMVKNAVIVPVGSKGGFIVKKRFSDKQKDLQHVIDQYKTFIRGLLDITDNYHGRKIVHPDNVVVYDEKDPYLVVAADKGTATFSDIANEISMEYGFWLGDAFASGGKTGYDHKKIGITAKGAWECVKRHFRELGKDIQKEEFTAVGIGDMSGDVFGNGMLLSGKTRLLAAFNHMHIFVDPNPDADVSYIERMRLFKLPRSTWKDYSDKVISEGGGVFDRSAKSIKLTKQMKELFKTTKDEVSGEELIRMILQLDAELLWNGGIGTYVKDSSETNADVGDHANDNVRINAEDLKVKVVGEGGNLGLTQKARIKYALLGGKINTDALDNSGGVDISDHEVNLKIILDQFIKKKLVKDIKERNKLILDLTKEVEKLVLKDNYMQSLAVSCDLIRSKTNQILFEETAKFLKEVGLLDFKLENISFIKEKRNVTRPELAVLLSYVKIFLYNEIEKNIDMNDPLVRKNYMSYYPDYMKKRFGEHLFEHKLAKEIAATVIVNKVVNQTGITFFIELFKNTNQDFSTLISNYMFIEELLDINNVRERIFALDNKATAEAQYNALIELEKTLKVGVQWLINKDNFKALIDNKELFLKIMERIPAKVTGKVKDMMKQFGDSLKDGGIPGGLAKQIAGIKYSKPAFDIFELIVSKGYDIDVAINSYFKVGETFKFLEIKNAIKEIVITSEWDRINRENLLNRLKLLQKLLTEKSCMDKFYIKSLHTKEETFFENYKNFLDDIMENKVTTLVPFNVILEMFYNLLH
ncbi:NAD-glutamate dehydrogenase [Deferribacter autotrophicus]|uniref:NAD-glutamate dehydrogenase n=1 Tax=Deferribacter autotrophicus TaxID=500465 RepID=A0A5A8F0Q6_9BACT|nr:NAD-glutamate dehydrogenase domain-containing protein [Deferribacter autotrophicus]KAA0256897.1 NAD-glutamate dehydrogenase [Deferribacter autotrophicus]